jgi:antibiotic biosynthesis monooxygenase (ABM) superfamily enzyme
MSASAKVAETGGDPLAVTSVIRHKVKAGYESRYEAWLKDVTPIAQTFPGHSGVNFIRPPKGSRSYATVLHFDTFEHLEGWLSSDARKRLLAEIQPYLEGGDRVENRTGLEFWFTPPDSEQKQAKRYKQFLVTWSVIFPLTIFVPWGPASAVPSDPVLRLAGHQQSYHLWRDRRPPDLRYHAALRTHTRDMAIPLNP